MPQLNRSSTRLVRRGKGRRGGSGGILVGRRAPAFEKGILFQQLRRPSTCAASSTTRRASRSASSTPRTSMLELAERQVLGGHKDETIRYRGAIDTGAAQGRFEDAVAADGDVPPRPPDTLDDSVPEASSTSAPISPSRSAASRRVSSRSRTRRTSSCAREEPTPTGGAGPSAEPRALCGWSPRRFRSRTSCGASLYDLKDSVILSSATLRVGSDFKYMSKRLGFSDAGEKGERYESFVATSPFDYFRQSLVCWRRTAFPIPPSIRPATPRQWRTLMTTSSARPQAALSCCSRAMR